MAKRGSRRLAISRQAVLAFPDSVEVRAVPGAGKTELVCSKICSVLHDLRTSARSTLALTYTRSGVKAIQGRLGLSLAPEDLARVEVATLHSFALTSILKPFAGLTGRFSSSVGFVTQESPEFRLAVEEAEGSKSYDLTDYGFLRRRSDGTPAASNKISAKKAARFWERLESQSLVDTASLFYYAGTILRTHPWVCELICARYAWIIVDEYQDTLEPQLTILQELSKTDISKFLLVGDPDQMLYEFAGVSPEALETFSRTNTSALADLNECYRCGDQICADAQALIQRDPPILCASGLVGQVFYKTVSDIPTFIQKSLIPSLERRGIPLNEAAVLLPITPNVDLVRALRASGIPCTGDKLREYQRTLWSDFTEAIAALTLQFDSASYRAAVDALVDLLSDAAYTRYVPGHCDPLEAWPLEASSLASVDESAGSLSAKLLVALSAQAGVLYQANRLELIRPQAEDFSKLIRTTTITLAEMAEFAVPRNSLHILTINGAKGLQFRAVALLQLDNGLLPHRKQINAAAERRKFYVGITRAKELLVYSSSPNLRSTFLDEIGAVSKTPS